MPLFRVRKHAAFRLAEHLVPVPGDEVIEPIPRSPRYNPPHLRDAPNAAYGLGKEEKGISLRQQSLVWLSIVEHRIDRVEILVIDAVPAQQPGGQVALQRSELKTVMTISFQQKLNSSIAKTADAVVKDYRFRFGFTHGSTSNPAT